MVAYGDRAPTFRCPDPAQDWLQADLARDHPRLTIGATPVGCEGLDDCAAATASASFSNTSCSSDVAARTYRGRRIVQPIARSASACNSPTPSYSFTCAKLNPLQLARQRWCGTMQSERKEPF